MNFDKKAVYIERSDFHSLFNVLKDHGYSIVGPTVQKNAIVYDKLDSVDMLPQGWGDEQGAGIYRIKKLDSAPEVSEALFGYNVGPHSWKKFLFPPKSRVWSAQKTDDGGHKIVEENYDEETPYAFIGVRACELKALAIQDKVFMGGEHTDVAYSKRREKSFIVAVNCSQSAKTCFCVSMDAGPEVTSGFDISLTEVLSDGQHYFVAQAGSEKGQEVLNSVPSKAVETFHLEAAEACIENAKNQERNIDVNGLKELLASNLESDHWDDVAKRCTSCANCTLVCPTCFCSKIEEVTDLTGDNSERWKAWDSCFTTDFSYIHGGEVRSSSKSRYRQWITHKLSSWIDQFGESGCVGCGRCITWCPVGIDITEEARRVKERGI